ncbi:group II intron reverse transcriptase/maturase [Oceanidesulfovibrio indonesiensis]|nr:group II intron reverse transcriptase/maturase [Oceanidesulfovibrio indonesiensis]
MREAARKDKNARFTALLHHITQETLRESFHALRRQAAPGVDGLTCEQYQVDLGDRLKDLHDRVHGGSYRALPSRRVYIPKSDGRRRPLGIAALEDKIVQHAVSQVLSCIYEEDFLGFSYGFRPGRGAHDALDALSVGLKSKKVNWVLDADIQGFFDTIDHEWMVRFVEHRVADPRIIRLVRKWLRVGVSEDGTWSGAEVGTPQGAIISPLLANVYLHYVLDQWAHHWRRSASGDVIIVRYADDFVLGFQHRHDAERFLSDLKARLEQFGLALHPGKTRLIEFGRFAADNRRKRGEGRPEAFDFLGFTHCCAKTRIRKRFHIQRRTVKERLRAFLAKVKATLRKRMHDPIIEVGSWLQRVVLGYYRYHAVSGNSYALNTLRQEIAWYWLKMLRRRGQKQRMNWKTFSPIVKRWIPVPKVMHPYPNERFYAKHPR